jgi:hypothetical protein
MKEANQRKAYKQRKGRFVFGDCPDAHLGSAFPIAFLNLLKSPSARSPIFTMRGKFMEFVPPCRGLKEIVRNVMSSP